MDQKEEMRDIRLFIENLNKVVRFLCKKKSLPNAGQQPIRVWDINDRNRRDAPCYFARTRRQLRPSSFDNKRWISL